MAIKLRYKIFYQLFKLIGRKVPAPNQPVPNKVLFLCHPGVGDLLLTTPVFENFKDKFPNACIDVVVGQRGGEILSHNPNLNNIYRRISRQFKLRELGFIKVIRQKKYDYIIDLCDWASPSRLLKIKLMGGKYRLRLRHADVENKRGPAESWNVFDAVVNANDKDHFSHYQSTILKFFHIIPKPIRYSLYLSDTKTQQNILTHHNKPIIFVNVTGSRENNSLTYAHTEAILKTVCTTYPTASIIFDAFSVRWTKEKQQTLQQHFPQVEFKTDLTLAAVVEWIKHADLLVGTDSGTAHIATSVGTRQIILSLNIDDIVQYFLPPYGEYQHLCLDVDNHQKLQALPELLQTLLPK